MIRLEIKEWNGQFQRAGLLDLIRRKIQGSTMGGSVLVDFQDARITDAQVGYVMRDFHEHKVKFCGCIASLPFPLPPDVVIRGPSWN